MTGRENYVRRLDERGADFSPQMVAEGRRSDAV